MAGERAGGVRHRDLKDAWQTQVFEVELRLLLLVRLIRIFDQLHQKCIFKRLMENNHVD